MDWFLYDRDPRREIDNMLNVVLILFKVDSKAVI